jgi:hypothetical protein
MVLVLLKQERVQTVTCEVARALSWDLLRAEIGAAAPKPGSASRSSNSLIALVA